MSALVCALLATLLLPAAGVDGFQPGAAQRPRDPWVLRCVLDGRARMITVALSDDLWVAYDAELCSFYAAWKGDVALDGAVFTTRHGPQPTLRGETYSRSPQAVLEDGWSLTRGGRPLELRPRYKGYTLGATGQLSLDYELELPAGERVTIQERPGFRRAHRVARMDLLKRAGVGADAPGFERRFWVEGLPAGTELRLAYALDCAWLATGPARDAAEVALEEGTQPRRCSGTLVWSGGAPGEVLLNGISAVFQPAPEDGEQR